MSNAERLVQNEEVEIRVTYESLTITHKVSFPAFLPSAGRRQAGLPIFLLEAGVIFLSKHVALKSS
jgi:hypothetical protein